MSVFSGPLSGTGGTAEAHWSDTSGVENPVDIEPTESTRTVLASGFNGLQFDAVHRLNCGHDALHVPSGNSITVGGWFFFDTSAAFVKLISKPIGTGWGVPFASWWLGQDGAKGIEFAWGGSSGTVASGSFAMPTGQWIHMVGRYDDATDKAEVFIDGSSDGSTVTANTAGATTQPLMIANRSSTSPGDGFNGTTMEIAAFGRALSDAEITAWFDEQNPAGGGAKRALPDNQSSGGWLDMTDNFLLIHGYVA